MSEPVPVFVTCIWSNIKYWDSVWKFSLSVCKYPPLLHNPVWIGTVSVKCRSWGTWLEHFDVASSAFRSFFLPICIYIYIYIYIYNLHNGECASVFNALFKTRRVSAFAFLRGLNMQLLQSRNSIYLSFLYISFLYIYICYFVIIWPVGAKWETSE